MALIPWWLSEQIAFQQTKLFCHKQFGRIYIFTATKMDAIEKAFWHPLILGGVANNIKHSLDQPIVCCSVLNILHWRNLQIPRQERKISLIIKICTPVNQIEEDHFNNTQVLIKHHCCCIFSFFISYPSQLGWKI